MSDVRTKTQILGGRSGMCRKLHCKGDGDDDGALRVKERRRGGSRDRETWREEWVLESRQLGMNQSQGSMDAD